MKLRGGMWVADTSDVEALSAMLKVAEPASAVKIASATRKLLRNAPVDKQLSTRQDIESHTLELAACFIKAVMQ